MRYGRIAGALFVVAALLSVPSTVLIEPRPEAAAYGLTLAAIVTGLVCLVVPWGRLSMDWLHAVAIAGIVEIAAGLAVIDPAYGFYLIFVIGFVAYVFPRWDTIAAYLGLMTIALLAPVFLDPDNGREILRSAILYLPGMLAVGLTMVYLRDRQDAKEEAYTRFAQDVLGIASLIRDSASRRGAGEDAVPVKPGDGSVGPPIEAMLADARHAPRPDPIEATWRSLRARRDFVPLAALVSVGAAVCVMVLAIATLSLVGPSAEVDELTVDVPPPLTATPVAKGPQLGEPERATTGERERDGDRANRDRGGRRGTDKPSAPVSAGDASATPAQGEEGAAPPAQTDFATEPAPPAPEAAAREPAREVEEPAANSTQPGSQNGTADVLDDVIDGGVDALGSLLGRQN